MFNSQPLSGIEVTESLESYACYATEFGSEEVDLLGHCAVAEGRLDQLWYETVRNVLAGEPSNPIKEYDAGQDLMVPLHAVFYLDHGAWQQQFAEHFERFGAAEAAVDYQSEIMLERLQYLYVASRFIRLAHAAGKPELVSPELIRTVFNSIERVWQLEPAWQWGQPPFPGGVRERVNWKLDTYDLPLSFYRGIIDEEQFVFVIAADLRGYERLTDREGTHSSMISEILDVTLRVHQQGDRAR